ncbi:hypothetical protein EMA8858_03969 [Emticicia aquatica]|uniref:Phosphatidic acid phosphatase type 2/haloperoxidase domain-containing protein n=2 Tax=Emticicia aquatica TaxID=1681835 RepID=A0ABN8F370_9BACT|nr:hypothetical protein EMA8858_03969 [Emticicia aquatica]
MQFRLLQHKMTYFIAIVLMAVSSLLCYGFEGKSDAKVVAENHISAEVAVKWGQMTVRIMKATPNGSPTYGSRAVGYMGLVMYESVVEGALKCKSMEGQLAGLMNLPKTDKTKKYNWILSLNAGQAYMLKRLYEQTDKVNIASIDSLENAINQSQVATTSLEVKEHSVQYGRAIAEAIFEWSKTDGGFEGYKKNFDSTYTLPVGNGYWKAPPKGQSPVALPLHPYWGKNRTFAPANGALPVPKMIAFDYRKDSQYYAQMYEVYTKRKTLTQEEKEIANWWGDDPSQTFSPPGHSYNLATIAIKTAKPDLFKAAETYAKIGMAVADAFINCWKCKYTYHAERPFFFIYYNMSTMWDLFWPEPPFPAFYSGHAGQAAAAAMVLTDLYGSSFKFTDDSHVGRPKDEERLVEFKARHFNSFWESALESANSRLYGGIHTCQDNEVGLAEGKKIGQNINTLAWRR